jgi:hypothetical protein
VALPAPVSVVDVTSADTIRNGVKAIVAAAA